MATTPENRIGLVSAISLGVGGMIGAGIFSILGVVANSKIKSGTGALVRPVTGGDPGCLVGLT